MRPLYKPCIVAVGAALSDARASHRSALIRMRYLHAHTERATAELSLKQWHMRQLTLL